MASSFGPIDLTNVIRRDNRGGIPLWETNDPTIRTPLAYGGESVQDNFQRLGTLTLTLRFPTYATWVAFVARVGPAGTATLVMRNASFANTTLSQVTSPLWMRDGSVECTARFSRRGYS